MSALDKWRRFEEEAREIRRREADWNFIEKQPPRIKAALKYYIEVGDLYVASRIAGLTIEEFNELEEKSWDTKCCVSFFVY
uniref:PaREP6 n=1 Tax=Ignisphaera aggregans TaxID=334771 RepID=A0A7C5Z0X0_9CREN